MRTYGILGGGDTCILGRSRLGGLYRPRQMLMALMTWEVALAKGGCVYNEA